MRNFDHNWIINVNKLRAKLVGKGKKIPLNYRRFVTDFVIPLKWNRQRDGEYDVMNPDQNGSSFVGKVSVRVSQKEEGKNCSAHRIFVACPECGAYKPAGRLHQHINTGVCKNAKAKS